MEHIKNCWPLLRILFCSVAVFLLACMTSDQGEKALNMQIDGDNDSLLTFDTLIVKVYSKDSSFSQELFHGKLTDPKKVSNMPLDSRVGTEYTVYIVGYKAGKIGVKKSIEFFASGTYRSDDLPLETGIPDTIAITSPSLEILAPTDTSVAEGDSLRFRVTAKNKLGGPVTITLKDAAPGAALDTVGQGPGDGYFTWRPNFDQGRPDTYAMTFASASADKKAEKIVRIKVLNINRPPKISAIKDQMVKENETLSFPVVALDPDHDSLTLTASGLPNSAVFSSGIFTWKPSEGQPGNYSVKFRAFDGVDSDVVSLLITAGNVETPPPITLTITSPSQDTSVNFTPITILYTINGAPFQKKVALKEGKNRIQIDTTVQNRVGFDTILITLDTIPPARPIVDGISPIRTRRPSWSWNNGSNATGLFRLRLDNNDLSAAAPIGDTTYTPLKDLDPGSHTLFVQERDAAGNWSQSGERTVRIDTTPPAPPLVSVNPTSPTNNPLPTWAWNGIGGDINGNFQYKLDSPDFPNGATESRKTSFTPSKGSELKEGLHVLYVRQQDSAGNWSLPGSALIAVDLLPPGKPKITLAKTSPTNNRRPTWLLASGVDGMGIFRMKIDDSIWSTGARTGQATEFTPGSDLDDGVHTLYAQERDSAGNWSTTVWKSVALDLTGPNAPQIDSTPYSPLNSLRPIWTWKSGGGGMKKYRCKIDTVDLAGAPEISDSAFTPNHNLTQGAHTISVQERDSVGNWSKASARQIFISLREFVGSPSFAKGIGAEIETNSKGIPYLSYVESGFIKVKKFEDGAWKDVGAPIATTSISYQLRLSPKDVPYLAYQNASGSTIYVTVLRLVGNTWSVLEGETHTVIDGENGFGIAVDGQESAYLAFKDPNSGLQVLKNAGYWISIGDTALKALGLTTGNNIEVTSSGIPYVFASVNSDWDPNVWTLSSNKWVQLPGFGTTVAPWYPDLRVTQIGGVFVSFFADTEGGSRTKIVSYKNGNWETIFPGDNNPPLPISISASGILFSLQQSVYKFTGTRWIAVGAAVDSYEGSKKLAIAPNGVGYLSIEADNSISVLKISFEP
jgi:hypothetical protein